MVTFLLVGRLTPLCYLCPTMSLSNPFKSDTCHFYKQTKNLNTGEIIMINTVIENIENIVNAEDFEQPELSGFSEACFDMNTEGDLAQTMSEFHHDAPEVSADESDCSEWNITPTEWFSEIEKALTCLIAERLEL